MSDDRTARRAKQGHAVQAVGALVDADHAIGRVNPDLPDRDVLLTAARVHSNLDIAHAIRDASQAIEKAGRAIAVAMQSSGWSAEDAEAQLGDHDDCSDC